MAEIFFLFSIGDPSIPDKALRLGYSLLVNKDYNIGEDLILITCDQMANVNLYRRFYVLPDSSFNDEFSRGHGTKKTGKDFQYIMDRVGAAAIDLTLYKTPSVNREVCVGSLAFQSRTYPAESEPLEPRPSSFAEVFESLRIYIRQSTEPISNGKTPRTVYAFPNALSLMREDASLAPWPSLHIMS